MSCFRCGRSALQTVHRPAQCVVQRRPLHLGRAVAAVGVGVADAAGALALQALPAQGAAEGVFDLLPVREQLVEAGLSKTIRGARRPQAHSRP